MVRLAVSGKNVSFNESSSRYGGSSSRPTTNYTEDEPFLKAAQALTLDEIKEIFEQASQQHKEPVVFAAMIRQSIMNAADRKNGSLGAGKVKSRSSSHSARLLGQAIASEYRYAMLGLILGLATIIGGVILGLHGVIGSTSWSAKLLGLESNLNDATPGVILFIVGMFLVLSTKPKVNLDNLKG